MTVAALYTVYNEENRLSLALEGTSTWADEIIVVDKSSTDSSVEIAQKYGAKIIKMPFSRAGDDPTASHFKDIKSKWVVWLTPSEQPTLALAKWFKTIPSSFGDEVDCIQIPVKIYTFGEFVNRNGPWAVSFQARVLNKNQVKVDERVHRHWKITKNTRRLNYHDTVFLLHCTHHDFDSFIEKHLDYAKLEADQAPNKLERCKEALSRLNQHDKNFSGHGIPGARSLAAWKIYHSLIALRCLTYDLSFDSVNEKYNEMLAELVKSMKDDLY